MFCFRIPSFGIRNSEAFDLPAMPFSSSNENSQGILALTTIRLVPLMMHGRRVFGFWNCPSTSLRMVSQSNHLGFRPARNAYVLLKWNTTRYVLSNAYFSCTNCNAWQAGIRISACPGATYLEWYIVTVILRRWEIWSTILLSQVWARDLIVLKILLFDQVKIYFTITLVH